MITINLLPISSFKQKFKGRVLLTVFFLMLLLGLAGIFSVKTFVFDTDIENKKSQAQSLTRESTAVKGQVAEATKKTQLTVRKWKQLAAIMELEERRRDQTRLLAEVESLVPKDNSWLASLSHSNGKLTLTGISKDKETISEFLTRLQNSSYLEKSSVYPGEINQNLRLHGMLLTNFTITADTKFPQPAIMHSGLEKFDLPSSEKFAELVKAAAPDLAAGILADDGGSSK